MPLATVWKGPIVLRDIIFINKHNLFNKQSIEKQIFTISSMLHLQATAPPLIDKNHVSG